MMVLAQATADTIQVVTGWGSEETSLVNSCSAVCTILPVHKLLRPKGVLFIGSFVRKSRY